MPRKKSRRVPTGATAPRYAAGPRVLKPTPKTSSNVIQLSPASARDAEAEAPRPATPVAVDWTWFDAGVVAMRNAFDFQAALIQHMFLLSPASLASRNFALSHVRPN